MSYGKDENWILDTGREIQMVNTYLLLAGLHASWVNIIFWYLLHYSCIILIIPNYSGNSRILTTIKISKIIPTSLLPIHNYVKSSILSDIVSFATIFIWLLSFILDFATHSSIMFGNTLIIAPSTIWMCI